MAKLKPNIKVDIVIATAGIGSRMQTVSKDLHKGLLPYKDAPIIWHLVKKIPRSLKIGVLLGHLGDQISDFLKVCFPEREFVFIEVDDWTSSKSGTAYSLFCAETYLEDSFWYLPCDGYFDEDIFEEKYQTSVFFSKYLSDDDSKHYQSFDLTEDGRIHKSFHKTEGLKHYSAFSGIMYIDRKSDFFSRLRETKVREFASSIQVGAQTKDLNSWIDLGNENSYRRAMLASEGFDFTKPDEFTFILPDKIVKWSADATMTKLKLVKPNSLPHVFPKNVHSSPNFLVYDKAQGNSFYENVSVDTFNLLLSWLEKNLWIPSDLQLESDCLEFYRDKTLRRLEKMSERRRNTPYSISSVNGTKVQSIEDYIEKIDWGKLVSAPRAAIIHGDLQFDNVIFNPDETSFTLIDWRTTFGSQNLFGDMYYDFAKLLAGIRLNYRQIKQNNFSVTARQTEVDVRMPSANESQELEKILMKKAREIDLDLYKIETLVALIYLNMAPLHAEPFSLGLWAVGLERLEKLT